MNLIRKLLVKLLLMLIRKDVKKKEQVGDGKNIRCVTAPCSVCGRECILLCEKCVERFIL